MTRSHRKSNYRTPPQNCNVAKRLARSVLSLWTLLGVGKLLKKHHKPSRTNTQNLVTWCLQVERLDHVKNTRIQKNWSPKFLTRLFRSKCFLQDHPRCYKSIQTPARHQVEIVYEKSRIKVRFFSKKAAQIQDRLKVGADTTTNARDCEKVRSTTTTEAWRMKQSSPLFDGMNYFTTNHPSLTIMSRQSPPNIHLMGRSAPTALPVATHRTGT